ncbi:hypothetical protein BSNK01_05460 [Bacillaceae bacterium]
MLKYRMKEEPERLLVYFEGDMDIECTELIEEELIPHLGQYPCVEIDFAEVRFIDSTGIGLLMKLVENLKEKNVQVTIRRIRPEVFEILQFLQIPDILGKEIFVNEPAC